jgi:twinkle protein
VSNVVPISAHVDLVELYFAGLELHRSGGPQRGQSTGWAGVDELYTVGAGQLTVVTGMPNSGKSEWVDALMVNLAEADRDWLFAVYSPENYPLALHLVKLVEKRARKPFSTGAVPRMTEDEYCSHAQWALEHFFWLAHTPRTPLALLDAAISYQQPGRKLGVVLDPWNTLDHDRGGLSETDYVSRVLAEVAALVRETDAHVWLIVHPAKLQRNKDGTRPVPTPYDLAGSAHWYNKADNIVTINREQEELSQLVEVRVQKIRYKHIGHLGIATLRYDKVTGRYFEMTGGLDGETYIDPERGCEPPIAQTALQLQTAREPGEDDA